jgi:Superinfection immunity protein
LDRDFSSTFCRRFALLREKYDKLSIFLLNFFLGWSVIGWIVALVWACKNDRVVYVQNPQRY